MNKLKKHILILIISIIVLILSFSGKVFAVQEYINAWDRLHAYNTGWYCIEHRTKYGVYSMV